MTDHPHAAAPMSEERLANMRAFYEDVHSYGDYLGQREEVLSLLATLDQARAEAADRHRWFDEAQANKAACMEAQRDLSALRDAARKYRLAEVNLEYANASEKQPTSVMRRFAFERGVAAKDLDALLASPSAAQERGDEA